MLYQAVMNIGGSEPQRIESGIWDSSFKAFSELCALTYGRIPAKTNWHVYLIAKSKI